MTPNNVCKNIGEHFSRLLAFSTKSRVENTNLNRKPEPGVVFAAILAKMENLGFSRSNISVAMGHGRSIFWIGVYFMDLSICAKFQGRSSRASYLSQGSLLKMLSNMRLRPYWATYISTTKLDIPDLVFILWYYPTSATILASFAGVSLLLQNDRTTNLRDCPISRIMLAMWNSLSPNAETINSYNALILADRRLKMHFLTGNRVRKVEIWGQNRNWK